MAFELYLVQVGLSSKKPSVVTIGVLNGSIVPKYDAACGENVVGAIYAAINRITGCKAELVEFDIKNLKNGIFSVASRIKINDGEIFEARNEGVDIYEAVARGCIDAINNDLLVR